MGKAGTGKPQKSLRESRHALHTPAACRIRPRLRHPPRLQPARRRGRPGADRRRQEGGRGRLVHHGHRQSARPPARRQLREEIRHQGAVCARQCLRYGAQDHQRGARRQGAGRPVRRHQRDAAAQGSRPGRQIRARRRQGAGAAVRRQGPAVGRDPRLLHDARHQHGPGAAQGRAEELRGSARPEMARQAGVEFVDVELGRARASSAMC